MSLAPTRPPEAVYVIAVVIDFVDVIAVVFDFDFAIVSPVP
jgi:hypothetical protein